VESLAVAMGKSSIAAARSRSQGVIQRRWISVGVVMAGPGPELKRSQRWQRTRRLQFGGRKSSESTAGDNGSWELVGRQNVDVVGEHTPQMAVWNSSPKPPALFLHREMRTAFWGTEDSNVLPYTQIPLFIVPSAFARPASLRGLDGSERSCLTGMSAHVYGGLANRWRPSRASSQDGERQTPNFVPLRLVHYMPKPSGTSRVVTVSCLVVRGAPGMPGTA
jgi:hypothetical protein